MGHICGDETTGCGFHLKQRNQLGREHIAAFASSPTDADRVVPVSYTHLDVYKRQVFGFYIIDFEFCFVIIFT